jgi:hypothetical protein
MSEETKKVEQTEQEAKAAEVSEQDLDSVSGGGSEIGDIDVVVKKKPSGSGHSVA